jgi:hypothetical protein
MAGEVTEVLCFEPGERPVFCLTFTNGEKLVVKSEIRTGSGHADQSIPLAGAMMGQVSPTVQVEMLDKSEFVSLRTLIQFPGRFRPTQNAEATREYLELCTSEEAQPGSAWYKMPFVGQLKDITKGTPGLMLLRLKKPPALFSFGKIVAVDQFIGNNDRFNAMGELVNEGNLLFQQIDGTISPVGLDFFQAQGQAANLLVGPPDWGKNARGKYEYIWGGENLLHENNIRFFADRAIESLNAYFSKQNIRRITLFGPDDALEFANGMKEGIRELKQFLLMRGLPEGVRIRMDKLGWPYNANLPARPVKPAPLFKPARPGAKRPGPTIAGTLLAPVREGTRMAA